ncbi:hypothetical protein K435DRAFT_833722 [Dendrothele bispora CBS 962.96]|uniref:Uncharacterized protein n=1 Tax=Dendrothele bispora (strain CBS 962.96) TaxID=1314807 RepID=A0A4S8MVR3_DENBC|nr:hypothetical protein K435DRAFT_833722 [Dendrothele bispora CBS 962.96]
MIPEKEMLNTWISTYIIVTGSLKEFHCLHLQARINRTCLSDIIDINGFYFILIEHRNRRFMLGIHHVYGLNPRNAITIASRPSWPLRGSSRIFSVVHLLRTEMADYRIINAAFMLYDSSGDQLLQNRPRPKSLSRCGERFVIQYAIHGRDRAINFHGQWFPTSIRQPVLPAT